MDLEGIDVPPPCRRWPEVSKGSLDDVSRRCPGGCSCGEAWRGHPDPHAITCAESAGEPPMD